MSVKLLTEAHLEFLSLKGGCTVSSESTHVKIPHCWKSHVVAQLYSFNFYKLAEREIIGGSLIATPKIHYTRLWTRVQRRTVKK